MATATLNYDSQVSDVFNRFARNPLSDDDAKRAAAMDIQRDGGSSKLVDTRAMGVGQANAGAKSVPTDIFAALRQTVENHSPVMRHATIFETATGNQLSVPTTDDSVVGDMLGENSEDTAADDIAIDAVTLGAYLYSSKPLLVSRELVQDSDVPLQLYLGRVLGRRAARKANAHFTTGTGTAQPNGIVTASTEGKAAASPTAITYAELVDLQHSLSDAVAEVGMWMFNLATLAILKKITDTAGRPIWQPSMDGMGTILGSKFVLNANMPHVEADAKPIIFGDLSAYAVRMVSAVELQIVREKWADYGQAGFVARMRLDGDLLDSSSVVHLVMAS